jgi:hypothetical protein
VGLQAVKATFEDKPPITDDRGLQVCRMKSAALRLDALGSEWPIG